MYFCVDVTDRFFKGQNKLQHTRSVGRGVVSALWSFQTLHPRISVTAEGIGGIILLCFILHLI